MLNVHLKSGLLIALSGVMLSGCFEVDQGPGVNSTRDDTSSKQFQFDAAVANVDQPDVAPPSTSTMPGSAQALNAIPTISGSAATQVMADTRYEFQPRAADSDGDTLRFAATGLPGWASIDSVTGLVSGTPRPADAGVTADIVVSVSDGKGTAELAAFRVTVSTPAPVGIAPPATAPPASSTTPAVNNPPRISGAPGTSVQAQSSYSFKPSASDPEGQTLTFSVANKPSWAAFSTANGTLSGTPARDQDGTYNDIVISVSDGKSSVALPAFSIVVSQAPNTAPTINGSPATSLTADSSYSFRPNASDADGDSLSFTISGKPSWASFDSSTGSLSGKPTESQAGTYGNIVIRVSDGRATTSLPTFSIVVSGPTLGSATLAWAAPAQNTDGSSVTNLSGYRIYYGNSPGSLGTMVQVSNPGITTYVVDNLRSGTWYFAVSAYSASGSESDRSTVGSKAIP